ncbi:hypothetical protein TSOC_009403 [Tetrabaena socialis]|uniref:Ubiquitin-like protease family profile domain-containing protein n=1 Tax=Tetrabaena socialis TaxID=47790 RepID=A0A2J7ZVW7_9CHLO|nr:hypothetical protein TSOC_009403 [Tetrabaena socialis]|eukprot:PNH04423.1 hypothetical protein TSOC_009403 [Tetrabaena socialis]
MRTREKPWHVLEPEGKSGPSTCSPEAYETTFKTEGRCVSNKDIITIAERLKLHDGKKDIQGLLRNLHRVLGKDHALWVNHDLVKADKALSKSVSARFRPARPASWRRNPTMWLSTVDIEKVMEQYAASHQNFKFMGVHPRDFMTVKSMLGTCIGGNVVCKPSLPELRETGIAHMGVVFNLDRHDQRGSHWVACFISLDDRAPMYGAYYYDSVARPPPPEIASWMVQLQKGVAKVIGTTSQTRPFDLAYNRVRRQFQNTECGMFSMVFLAVAMRNEKTFADICTDMGNDQDMNKLRHVMYR